jgi:hypothetical protein
MLGIPMKPASALRHPPAITIAAMSATIHLEFVGID